ncbi:energy-coupling factor transport system substrate-specific component [Marmoricola sp. OAE513]|uniref:ECF transporter S component n=1 Tax=Marmoricola sp. OAE513 TaxID=2817894 RepID=UPI001E03DDDE
MRTTAPAIAPAIALRPRSAIAIGLATLAGLMAFLWPLLVSKESLLAENTAAPLVLGSLLPVVLAVVLFEISEGGLDPKAVAMLGVLSAIGAAIRPLGAGTAGIETVFFLLILGGRVFGAGFGFVLGATTLFGSALFTGGVGPWLPYQMLGAALVGLLAGLLPPLRGVPELLMLAAYGLVAGVLYGTLQNLSFWPYGLGLKTELSFVAGDPVAENLHRFVVFSFTTAFGWDLVRGITNVVLIVLTGPAILATLRRAARKASFSTTAPRSPGSPSRSGSSRPR